MVDGKKSGLHGGQVVAMSSDVRFVSVIAGTGGGKTFLGAIWLYNEISKYPNDQWMVVAPTYKLLQRATLPMFLDFFGGTELDGGPDAFKKGDMRYELPCGGMVYFCSADRPNALAGG